MSPPIDPDITSDVDARVSALRARIEQAATRAGRDPAGVTLVGAAKRQTTDRVAAAVLAGVYDIGHNYVQEARDMRTDLEARLDELGVETPPLRWRMIGHLQSNKAGAAVEGFDHIDALDSAKLARGLDRRAGEAGRHIDVILQVNLSGEESKSGLAEADVEGLIDVCRPLEHVDVVGLMTMPRPSADPEAARPTFAALRVLRDRLRSTPGAERLTELSMGMSGDFEIAVEEGATLVRVGTALFGERAPR